MEKGVYKIVIVNFTTSAAYFTQTLFNRLELSSLINRLKRSLKKPRTIIQTF